MKIRIGTAERAQAVWIFTRARDCEPKFRGFLVRGNTAAPARRRGIETSLKKGGGPMRSAQNLFTGTTGRILLPGIFLLLTVLGTLHGQQGSGRRPVDDLLFKVAVYGPSDDIFIWWGHAALIVENTRWKNARVFDWGIFSYPSDNFLWDFLHDRIRYKCTVEPLDLQMYVDEDRDITIYTLDLEAESKERILEYAENNVLPENSYYNYHEFRDNCSTRIRDIIDMGTGGQLKTWALDLPGRFTTRQHIRRFTWFRPVSDRILDFLMGQDLDAPITVWDEMFLPVEVGRNIAGFRYTDSSGAEHPLVRSVELANASKKRPPVLQAPLRLWPGDLLLGALPAAFAAGILGLRKKKPRIGRTAWGIFHSVLGLTAGIAGCALTYAWFFMKNDYIQQNINLLFINPLLLAAVPLGILTAAGRESPRQPERRLRILWAYVAAAGILTQLLRALPLFSQQNQSTAALILPAAALICCAAGDRYQFRFRPPKQEP
jgi:hypothetical protein